jgi:hypothetical protein
MKRKKNTFTQTFFEGQIMGDLILLKNNKKKYIDYKTI